MKLLQIFQYGYLVIAFYFLYDGISEWNTNRNAAYLRLFFSALAVFMFFFKRRFRKKIEDRNNNR